MPTRPAPSQPLAERYRPHSLDEVVGPAKGKAELRAWAEGWAAGHPPARRAVILSGPPGVGKTSSALALAEEFGWSVVEMNASDARNETAIEQVAGRASITHTLLAPIREGGRPHALILLDEADCLTGRLTEAARATAPPPPLNDFLRTRYGTVEALNRSWNLQPGGRPAPFAEWDALPKSPGRAAWARLPAAQRDLADWKGTNRPKDLSDRGGLGAIARLVRDTRQPVVLTVNDDRPLTRYSPVFRTGVLQVRFAPLRDAEMQRYLDRVAGAEGIRLAQGAIEAIVRRARGDLRAGVNDLEAIAPLPPGPSQLTVLGVRDLTSDLMILTEEALTAHRYFRNVEVQDRIDAPPDELFPWIEENVPNFAPDAMHRAEAFRVLAQADRFLRLARRARVWSLWSYASELMTGGVGLAIRDDAVPVREGAGFPQFLGEMGRSRNLRMVRDTMARRAGRRYHLSKVKLLSEFGPLLEQLLLVGAAPSAPPRRRAAARGLARELGLSREEIAYLLRTDPASPRVSAVLPADEGEEAETEVPAAVETAPEASAPAGRKLQRSLTEFSA